ncbi:uncharacterized protein isoform X2 [Leptinotarsa decemlineata]|uniref:uncharacterized protein isoform X2 n=1 Tax=Leptinotarsa decemlineata TaxID=7539 RepID=UPI003D308DA8
MWSAENTATLVDTLTIEDASFDMENTPELTNADFNSLTDLPQEITFSTDGMDTGEQEVVVESQDVMEHEEEVEAEEVFEDESDGYSQQSIKYSEQMLQNQTVKTSSVPPLRPLTIAPKPTKVPIAVKSVGGQQLLLLQGTTPGQTIKLVSSQGQELNLANISRPITFKPTLKTISTQGGNISFVPQKPVVMKKIIAPGQKTITKPLTTFSKQPQHYMVVQKSDQPVKIVQAQGSNIAMSSPTKTLTLQLAQEMGLLPNSKIIQQGQTVPKQTVLLSKNPQKTLKIVPQVSTAQLVTVGSNTKTISLGAVKGPAKILPASSLTANKGPQKILFKTATSSNTNILPQGQIIQVAGSQTLNSGQLHQINIPGRGMQYIKFVTTNPTDSNVLPTSTGNTVLRTSTATSIGNIVFSDVKTTTVNKIAPKPMTGKVAISPSPLSNTPVVVVPSNISPLPQTNKAAVPSNSAKSTPTGKTTSTGSDSSSPVAPKDEVDSDGMRPRKPCNCNKSQCLKLYCDCFANGEFCYMCKCLNCFNNLENEEHRSRAIKACLERNPHAFRPKIGKAKDVSGDQPVRKHTKGCNCKRSGCLKNYCECYEAKIACSNNCKCVGCRNIEDSIEKKNMRHMTTEKATNTPALPDGEAGSNKDNSHIRHRRTSGARKQTISFITDDVIEATTQCLLTVANNAEENMQDEETTQRLILEEFGRCLTEIIECSSNRVSS